MRFVPLMLVPLMWSGGVQAADCKSVVEELEAMRRAQQAVILSLANNHETFASTIEETTADLELHSKRVPAKALRSMNKTADAFRARGVAGKRQAEKLDHATGELIESVQACLR